MTEMTVWYDGACSLCRREISIMRQLDRRGATRFVDLSSSAAADCPKDRRALLQRFHAMEDGRILSGAAAFAAVWRAIPLLRRLGMAARSLRLLRLLERCYVRVLRFRPALQRLARGAGR
jgi:predicted DCC family thiol-disulfide oxidoreductase YuxK